MNARFSPHPRLVALVLGGCALACAAALAGPPTADARGGSDDPPTTTTTPTTPTTPGGGGGGGGGNGAGGRSEVRVSGSCGAGARSELRVTQQDSGSPIEARFDVYGKARSKWKVVVTHERDVAWRGNRWVVASAGYLRVARSLPDYDGPDTVSVRAWGPKGLTCRATVQLVERP